MTHNSATSIDVLSNRSIRPRPAIFSCHGAASVAPKFPVQQFSGKSGIKVFGGKVSGASVRDQSSVSVLEIGGLFRSDFHLAVIKIQFEQNFLVFVSKSKIEEKDEKEKFGFKGKIRLALRQSGPGTIAQSFEALAAFMKTKGTHKYTKI